MHVDATGEAGRGTLLVVIAGWRQWVLGSWKIATERSDLILPCIRQTTHLFGPPCAVMRDLGKAVTPAIKALLGELELDIPVLACHQHLSLKADEKNKKIFIGFSRSSSLNFNYLNENP